MKKYYAVKKGITPGIYLTWEDCKKNIDGVSGAVYRGFMTLEEAGVFLEGAVWIEKEAGALPEGAAEAATGALLEDDRTIGERDGQEAYQEEMPKGAIAYVDGSYNTATKEYSYGAVIFYEGKELHFSKKFSDPQWAKMRNVAGEIEGSMCAMRYCLEHRIPSLELYYDYEGIEKWCTGDWKANKEETQAYRDFYREISERVCVRFQKVKGHSGDTYNDLADLLAKQAVGNA